MNAGAKNAIKVTLVKSFHGQLANIAASVRGLGDVYKRQIFSGERIFASALMVARTTLIGLREP